MTTNFSLQKHARLSVAPMMDWTDRHCRYFHRLLSRNALLYTEMVTARAIVHGDQDRLLGYHDAEHPLAVQLGGSEPEFLAKASKVCVDYGYDEINLNCGCPSDRVQSGTFGAVLMAHPELVRDCVSAMQDAAPDIPITVKCRIGIDDQDPAEVLPRFLEIVSQAGVRNFTIHARKAWLQGLSPKENRDVPPLDYPLVLEMKAKFPDLWIGINGGITSLEQTEAFLESGLDGVMIGRSAYQSPASILCDADRRIWREDNPLGEPRDAVDAMLPYLEAELSRGTRLNAMTRHILGLFQGMPGARRWRRLLSENAHKDGAGVEVVLAARDAMEDLEQA